MPGTTVHKFKSDARPSDTKSVVLHKETDRRLLDHLRVTKRESEFWRRSAYFFLDFMEWLATQPDAPEPGRPFVYYRAWLEQRRSGPAQAPAAAVDPESLAAAILPGVRSIIEAALAGLSLGAPLSPLNMENGGVVDLAELFVTNEELVLG